MLEQTISAATLSELSRVGEFVAGRDDAWAIPRVSGEFLHMLVLLTRCKYGLEIGTSYGISGLWLGSAFQQNGGVLITVDNNPAKVDFAREAFGRAGLTSVVHPVLGKAEAILPTIDGTFDFVFIDAEKAASVRYFELVWPRLAPRATLVADNITSHAEEMAPYVTYVRRHPQLCSVLVPIGSGLELTVKLGAHVHRADGGRMH